MTNQLFKRDGTPFDGKLAHDEKGRPGFWHEAPCFRCGGAGGFRGWPGFTCFRCGRTMGAPGTGKEAPKFHRLYTTEELAKLNAAKDKRDAKKTAKLEAAEALRKADIAAKREALGRTHGVLLNRADEVKDVNRFVKDILEKADRYGTLSDKQIAALTNAVDRIDAEKRAGDASTFYGTVGERIAVVPVEVIRVGSYERTSRFAYHGVETVHIVTMSDGLGHYFVSKTPRFSATVGDKFLLTATIKAHDDYKGMKQTVVERVKTKELV